MSARQKQSIVDSPSRSYTDLDNPPILHVMRICITRIFGWIYCQYILHFLRVILLMELKSEAFASRLHRLEGWAGMLCGSVDLLCWPDPDGPKT
jgi:hypothetical protein